jgi:hypothetical protein
VYSYSGAVQDCCTCHSLVTGPGFPPWVNLFVLGLVASILAMMQLTARNRNDLFMKVRGAASPAGASFGVGVAG